MAISSSVAVKAGLGGLGTASVVAPTAYVVWDKYSSKQPSQEEATEEIALNEVEQEILKDTSSEWTVVDSNPSVQDSAVAKVSKEVTKQGDAAVTYTWECAITKEGTAEGVDKSKLINYLKQKLNKGDDTNKQSNRQKLVKACSKGRENSTEANSVKARLTLKVESYEESGSTMTTNLLGNGTTTEVQ